MDYRRLADDNSISRQGRQKATRYFESVRVLSVYMSVCVTLCAYDALRLQ